MISFKPKKPLPVGTLLEVKITILDSDGEEVNGTLVIGGVDEVQDFNSSAIATQRGVYELLYALWGHWETNHETQEIKKYEH